MKKVLLFLLSPRPKMPALVGWVAAILIIGPFALGGLGAGLNALSKALVGPSEINPGPLVSLLLWAPTLSWITWPSVDPAQPRNASRRRALH